MSEAIRKLLLRIELALLAFRDDEFKKSDCEQLLLDIHTALMEDW